MPAKLKTMPTDVSAETYLSGIADPARAADCRTLARLMTRLTKQEPVMWGPTIVGFGSYHYRYESGHEGDACLLGFSSRGADIALYLAPGFAETADLLARLGKHRAGKGCLYVKRLSDVDMKVLEALLRASMRELRRRYPGRTAGA